jgi:hypothetical protein
MSIEYTSANKQSAENKFKSFLDTLPDDVDLKITISSKKGSLKMNVRRPKKRGRLHRLIDKLKIKRKSHIQKS